MSNKKSTVMEVGFEVVAKGGDGLLRQWTESERHARSLFLKYSIEYDFLVDEVYVDEVAYLGGEEVRRERKANALCMRNTIGV